MAAFVLSSIRIVVVNHGTYLLLQKCKGRRARIRRRIIMRSLGAWSSLKDGAIVEMQFHAVYKKVSQHKWLLLFKKLVSLHPKNMCAESKIAKFRK